MDKYELTVRTFNKLAGKYQEKYMDFDFYFETYDTFCDLISNDKAICGEEPSLVLTSKLCNRTA